MVSENTKGVRNVKKVFLGIVGIAGVIVGALVIWKAVIPFIGTILSGFF